MYKLQTDRQFKSALLSALLVILTVCGIVFCYVANLPLKLSIMMIFALCFPFLSFSILSWGLRNQLYKGVRYAWKHYVMVLQIRDELLYAGIYNTRKIGNAKLAILPWITVYFEPDFSHGKVYIRNSVKFHKRLPKLNLSPALGNYVIEQVYTTATQNHYYYTFYDSSMKRKLQFESFDSFLKYSNSISQYELFVDRYTALPLTHQLLVGQTGSGKTYALHGYILQMLSKPVPYQLYFADSKGSSVFLLGERIAPERTAEDFDDIVALLEKFCAEMQKRKKVLKEILKEKIDADYQKENLPPYVLIFDEFADFSVYLQSRDKKQRDYVMQLITQIVLKGRQLGFFLWVVMQQSGSNNIPTYIRDNLPWKVVLGNADAQTYITTFGTGVDIPLRQMSIGEGVYAYPSIAPQPEVCAYATLDFDILGSLGAGVM